MLVNRLDIDMLNSIDRYDFNILKSRVSREDIDTYYAGRKIHVYIQDKYLVFDIDGLDKDYEHHVELYKTDNEIRAQFEFKGSLKVADDILFLLRKSFNKIFFEFCIKDTE